jgi:hypothetical protein
MENEKSAETVMSPKEKLENFWYHYKWHTIIGAVVVVIVIIVLSQLLTKPEYDAHILYAGDTRVLNTSADGDLPHYQRLLSSLKRVVGDENGDGSIDPNLQVLYALTEDQLAGISSDKTAEISLALTDSETLESALVVGEYYVCFLSEELFFQYDAIYDGSIFAPLAGYATSSEIDYEYASERGIYLRSLPYANTIDLPGDTVVCLRALNGYAQSINGKSNERAFAAGERIIKNILNYKK